MFKINFSPHNKVFGAQKLGSTFPECPRWLRACL